MQAIHLLIPNRIALKLHFPCVSGAVNPSNPFSTMTPFIRSFSFFAHLIGLIWVFSNVFKALY